MQTTTHTTRIAQFWKTTAILASLSIGLVGCPDPNASSTGLQTTTTDGTTTVSSSQETDPSAARLNCPEEDTNCVKLSGKLVFEGTATGSIRLDVQKVRDGSAPMLVKAEEASADGAFSFRVPKEYGKIIITGFIDQAGDGPSPQDPQGRSQIIVAGEDILDIQIEVKADNAPVQPKPPSEKPEEKGTTTPNTENSTTPTEPPPAQKNDGPPKDE